MYVKAWAFLCLWCAGRVATRKLRRSSASSELISPSRCQKAFDKKRLVAPPLKKEEGKTADEQCAAYNEAYDNKNPYELVRYNCDAAICDPDKKYDPGKPETLKPDTYQLPKGRGEICEKGAEETSTDAGPLSSAPLAGEWNEDLAVELAM